MKRSHIILQDFAAEEKFKSRQAVIPERHIPKNREEQARLLKRLYGSAINAAISNRGLSLVEDEYKASGTYLEMTIDKAIPMDSLDSKRGARLMNLKTCANERFLTATLFLQDEKREWLNRKIDQYSNPELDSDKTGKPANAMLINQIEDIAASSISDLFTQQEDRTVFNNMPNTAAETYEVWIRKNDDDFNVEGIRSKLNAINIEYCQQCLVFTEVVVMLVKTTKENLKKLIFVLDNLSELRIFKSASTLLSVNYNKERDWVELIGRSIEKTDSPTSRIGILDSGVNNSHPLLQPFLPTERCHNATTAGIRDKRNHGSLMAGLALFGDILEIIHAPGNVQINADLSSVKILPGKDEESNLPGFYGVITEDAISTARNDNAIIQCMAVTAEGETHGEPSAWSSAIDKTLFNQGEADSLLFVSAGNVEETGGMDYPDFNIHEEVKDPAQSWNAITVGAYTEKAIISDPDYQDVQPIAPMKGISPYSTTSMMWSNGLVKPEILMEGGNAIDDNGRLSSAPDDLNLVSTSGSSIHYFAAMYATSAATALAARLAAKIKNQNPTLSSLSIRALMVHSAEWTEEMIRQNTDTNGKLNIHTLLHTCGYGVPVPYKAIASEDCYATFIAEETMTPLVEGNEGKYKLNSMHFFELPWPKEILESMGEEEVTLRITLSYYIQPAPGAKTKHNKYKYPSLRLRFDVNNATENKAEFIQRVSNIVSDGVEKTDNNTTRWGIGIKERNNGSIMSDYITDSAVNIAMCNMIAVYPATGWWNSRKYTEDKSIKYSLVVSLETKDTEIYNTIQQKIEIPV